MNEIDDPRLVFYLENQRLIDEWASVSDDVRRAASEFYVSLGDDLESLASRLGDDVHVARSETSWPRVGLARRSWYTEDEHRVSICLETNLKHTSFVGGARVIGVRPEDGQKRAKELSDAIRTRIGDFQPASGLWRSNAYWPAYRNADGCSADRYWEDLSPFRSALTNQILEAWTIYNAFVDDGVAAVPVEG